MPRFFPYASRAYGPDYPRWNRLADYFFHHYGQRVRKIPLDAGFSCPNRDGTISASGCIFCNDQGSGTGLGDQGLSLLEQWETRRPDFKKNGINLFIAYLQSFSNTYGPIQRLAAVLDELKSLPDIAGIAVGTRPDCVDKEKLALIASVCDEQNWFDRWVEFGVQSSNDATLRRINRGHGRACAEEAIAAAGAAGLKVCVHLIAGLPGESREDFLASAAWASRQPIHGIKFHALYICGGTALARLYEKGGYTPLSHGEYVRAVADALALLRPEIVVQRLAGDPAPGELLAPAWACRGKDSSNKILSALTKRDSWQGKNR